jgi:hypothetical protein
MSFGENKVFWEEGSGGRFSTKCLGDSFKSAFDFKRCFDFDKSFFFFTQF